MKYDDASWHYGGNFPADLPPEAGATHIGMFVVWAWLNGLAGELRVEEFPEDIESARLRSQTPGALFRSACDEKFTAEDLNDEGNRFTVDYYGGGEPPTGPHSYLEDYALHFSDDSSGYGVPDTWENFDSIAPVIRERFEQWRSRQS